MITAKETARGTPGLANIRISGQTVRRRLRESGLRARRTVVGPILKKRHRTARLAWVHARRRWRLHTWQHVLFSDESRFSLRFSDGCYRVYGSDRFGGGRVMVWAGICHDGRTQLKIVQGTFHAVKYRDDILDPIVLPFLHCSAKL